MRCLVESRNLMHVRCAGQTAVELIGPGVIRALNRLEMAAGLLAHPSAAVAADIIKSAQLMLLIAQHDQAFARHVLQEIIAGIEELTLVADAEPACGENPFLFL